MSMSSPTIQSMFRNQAPCFAPKKVFNRNIGMRLPLILHRVTNPRKKPGIPGKCILYVYIYISQNHPEADR